MLCLFYRRQGCLSIKAPLFPQNSRGGFHSRSSQIFRKKTREERPVPLTIQIGWDKIIKMSAFDEKSIYVRAVTLI